MSDTDPRDDLDEAMDSSVTVVSDVDLASMDSFPASDPPPFWNRRPPPHEEEKADSDDPPS